MYICVCVRASREKGEEVGVLGAGRDGLVAAHKKEAEVPRWCVCVCVCVRWVGWGGEEVRRENGGTEGGREDGEWRMEGRGEGGREGGSREENVALYTNITLDYLIS